MSKNLTDLFCRTATSAGKPQKEYFDAKCPGLALRVGKEGRKTWTFAFTAPDGKRARMTLATYPGLSLENARLLGIKTKGLVEGGKDPRVAAVTITNKTVAQLVDDRVRLVLRPDADSFLRSCLEIERRYDRNVVPVVGAMAVKDFRISHLNLVLDPIVARGSPIEANRTFEDLRALFNFAVRRGEIDHSPLAAAEPPSVKKSKTRSLSLDEIRSLWLDGRTIMGRSPNVPDILCLTLALGQRPGEVAGMELREVNVLKRLWTIPAHRVKNGHEHAVPLNDLAMAIIMPRLRTNGRYIFPNEEGDSSTPNYTVSTATARAVNPTSAHPLGRLGIAKFTPHDLRRTIATQMLKKENGLGISRFDRALVLNHRSTTKANVTDEVYDQNDYLEEKREALDKWGAFLAKLVGEQAKQREAA